MNKTIIPFLIFSFLLVSCSSSQRIDKTKFASLYSTTKEIEGATKVGIAYLNFAELLRKFSSEIEKVKDKASTSQEKELLVLYEKVLECYQDSLTLWKSIIDYHIDETGEQVLGGHGVIESLRPLLMKYHIETERDPVYSVDYIPQLSLQKIWQEASDNANKANDIYLGKQKLKTTDSKEANKESKAGKQLLLGSYVNRGNEFNKEGDYNQAIAFYNKAIEIDPNVFEAYLNRGISYAKKKELDNAINDFTKAISLNPNFGESYYNRAVIYAQKGNYEQAVVDYRKSISLGYQGDPEFLEKIKDNSIARQAAGENAQDERTEMYKVSINLEGIIFDPHGNSSAVINGQTVSEGGKVSGARVAKINQDSVDIIVNGEKENIRIGQSSFAK